MPKLLWQAILNLVILNIRPGRSAKAYQTVWTEQGSPLRYHTQAQRDKIAAALRPKYGDDLVVEMAMRYGNPNISEVLDTMLQQGIRKLLVLPLYPQYCAATTGSTFDAIATDFSKRRWLPDLRFISHYHDHNNYIDAAANSIQHFQRAHGVPEKLIFSYHGTPLRYLKNGDPYHCECHKTTRLIANKLGLQAHQYLTTFQSRFGREQWLQPYTDDTLKNLPSSGVKSVQVVCPGFAADCLETIEEIAGENREYFMHAGGSSYQYIPCLNSDDEHIQALTALIEDNLAHWQVATAQELHTRSQEYDRSNA